MEHPEDALDVLAKKSGLSVLLRPLTNGYTWHDLVDPSGHHILRVIEPPAEWPVRVIHYHAELRADGNPAAETEYARCGDGHCPNTPHPDNVPEGARFTRKEFERMDKQKGCTPIDTPTKLLKVCEQLLEHEETKKGCARCQRETRRRGRMKAAAPVEAPPAAKPNEHPVVTFPKKVPVGDGVGI